MKYFRFMFIPVLVGLMAGLGVVPVQAQADLMFRGDHQRNSEFMIDYAWFYEPDSAVIRLEVYWQLFNSALVFEPLDGNLVAEYDITIRVKDDDDRQVDSFRKSREITVGSDAQARSTTDFRTNQANFRLRPDKYRVEVTLRDKKSGRAIARELKFKLKDVKSKKPRLSQLELVNAVLPAGEKASPFDKGDLRVVPSLSGEYGERQNNRLRFYMEIYRGSGEADEVFVETSIRKQWGGLAYRDSLTSVLEEPVSRQFREISLEGMAAGEYDLEVRLRNRRFKEIDSQKRTFFVEWSQTALMREGYKTVLGLLRLIAGSKQMDKLEEAEGHEDRKAALDEFWLEWDPTPGTAENEIKREFFRRVKLANRMFAFMRQPGWKTDRGIVFIKHGEPDEIDDQPMDIDAYPYQKWHYHRGGTYRQFTFVDRNGDGDYRLLYPYDGLNQRPNF